MVLERWRGSANRLRNSSTVAGALVIQWLTSSRR